MRNRSDDPVREQLQEAIREIEVMAGLTDLTPRLRIGRPSFDGLASSPFVTRGFKAVRGAEAPVASRPAAVFNTDAAPHAVSIGVTSADFRDGKTTVAISLASCLAHDFDAQVVLVDADFETHSIAREYGLQDRPGLSDVLAGTTDLPAVAHRFRRAPLTVITAGSRQADAARMARSQELVSLLDSLKRMSGFVVMDLPATLRSMNTPVLASRCDGVIVVVRAGRTSRRDLERTLELLQDANIIGVVVNRQHSNVPGWVDRLLALPR